LKENATYNSRDIWEVKKIIDDMKRVGDLNGVVIANRDGDLIAENIENVFDGNKFSAMCASILESAEDLSKGLNSRKLGKVIAELDKGQSIFIVQYDAKIFFSFILGNTSKMDLVLKIFENYSFNL
jgi:predicted regulator of Ras-like GTPase activity (Roadblock/LC7/MglB family)